MNPKDVKDLKSKGLPCAYRITAESFKVTVLLAPSVSEPVLDFLAPVLPSN
jgi:hypothetical protein